MASPNSQSSVGLQNLSNNQAVRLLAVKKSVDCNLAGDNALPVISSNKYSVSAVLVTNASISLTTAHASVYPLPAAGGTAIVSDAALSSLSASTVVDTMTINSTAAQTGQFIYFRIGTAQGAAATADDYIYGYDLDIQ